MNNAFSCVTLFVSLFLVAMIPILTANIHTYFNDNPTNIDTDVPNTFSSSFFTQHKATAITNMQSIHLMDINNAIFCAYRKIVKKTLCHCRYKLQSDFRLY